MQLRNEIKDQEKYKDGPGILLEAIAVYRRRADVEGVGGRVDLQCLCQAPVSLQSGTLLVTFKSGNTNMPISNLKPQFGDLMH